MAEATDAFWHFIKRETREQLKLPGVFSLRRLDLRVKFVKEALANDGRFDELLAKIPDFDRCKSGPWATFVKDWLADIQEEFKQQRREQRSKAPHEAEESGAAVEAPQKEEAAAIPTQLVVARPAAHPPPRCTVKRSRIEVPLPAELKCIAECEVLAEIIRQKLSALPAESIKRALLSAERLALELTDLKVVAAAQAEEALPAGVGEEEYDTDGLGFCSPPAFPEPALSEEPLLGGVGAEECGADGSAVRTLPLAESTPAQIPAWLVDELLLTNGLCEEDYDSDGWGFCHAPRAPTIRQTERLGTEIRRDDDELDLLVCLNSQK